MMVKPFHNVTREKDMKSLTEPITRAITTNPRFMALVKARARVRWGLSAIMIGLFFGFVLLVCFGRDVLGTRLGALPLCLYLAIGMVLSVVALTGIYVHRANGLFEHMTDEFVKETGL